MKKVYYFALLILGLYSCKNDPNAVLTKSNSISIPISEHYSDVSIGLDYNEYNNKQCLTYLTLNLLTKKEEILFYDLKAQKLVNKITFSNEKGFSKSAQGYKFIGKDTILATNFFNDSLYITDRETNIKYATLLNYNDEKNKQKISKISPNSNTPFIVKNEMLFFTPRITFQKKEDLYKKPIFYNYNLIKRTFTPCVFTFPKEYIDSGVFNQEFSYCYDGKNLIISPSHSNEIWVTDLGFKSIKKMIAKSDKYRKFNAFTTNDISMQEFLYGKCSNTYYYGLYYDKFRKVYYRICFPGRDIEKDDKNLAKESDYPKNMSIIVLDEDLIKIGESHFEDYEFESIFFIAPDGLYVKSNNPSRKDYDENFLKFTKLKLEYE